MSPSQVTGFVYGHHIGQCHLQVYSLAHLTQYHCWNLGKDMHVLNSGDKWDHFVRKLHGHMRCKMRTALMKVNGCNWVRLPLESIVVRLPSPVLLFGIQPTRNGLGFLPSRVMLVVPLTICSPPCLLVWDVPLQRTIFSFPTLNSISQCFSCKPNCISSPDNPSLSKPHCVWPLK